MMEMKHVVALAAVALAVSLDALSHGERRAPAHDYAKAQETAFGKAFDPRHAFRTVRVDMADTMRFTPAEITVKRGDTVRFVATNRGKLMHEMVLGTRKELE